MSACKSCGAALVWLKTRAGKSIPVDESEAALAYARDGAEFDAKDEGLVTHFRTCPQAEEHRRP